jgi:sigma-54 dependent transcriptional regulator, acetoin dehydrogenase operon transcriptional activator AcoR
MNNQEQQKRMIAESHRRCQEFGVETERVYPSKVLQGDVLKRKLLENEGLLDIAAPFMDILYEAVANSGFFIILTDKDGYILRSNGDPDAILQSEKLNMVIGASMAEESIGTNAMGTCLFEGKPLQVTAHEHYIKAYHRWTCSAAPIRNPKGETIASLNLTGDSKLLHPHTLGLVVAAVRAVENQLIGDKAREQLNETFHYLQSVLESVSAGIMTIDTCGNVKTINPWACSLLNLEKDKLINKSINSLLPIWKDIFKRFERGESFLDAEISLPGPRNKERYDLSAYPIYDENKQIIGMVLVIKGIQKIFNLVNKYTGMRAHYTFDDIVGGSQEIMQIIDHAKTIAGAPSTVLLMGDSGTGKELLAQSIHNASPRRNEVFIAVNCGALPKNLIESELFGYEEGAFTGSRKGGHAGKFELANGGTIFLDEIGEMPLDMQVNLLRVLQEGYVMRIGGTKNITVDVRVIAATKKNLIEELRKGTFREDLFYRLSVIPLFIPPLRERKQDIKALLNHFMNVKARKLNKPVPHISQELQEQIMRYNWPGNVRELENFVENLVNFNGMSSFNIISTEHPVGFHDYNSSTDARPIPGNEPTNKLLDSRPVSLEDLEKDAIKASMAHHKGNVTQVSRQLGISRTTLYSKMRKYSLELI